jgi:hypothetical protein
MFEQVIDYLSSKLSPGFFPEPQPEAPQRLRAGEEAVAAMAVCLRWGSYLAVLADRDRPLWPQARKTGTSRIADPEMARINIEASAALEQWIGLMRDDPGLYVRLVWATRQLPMTLRSTSTPREPPHLMALADPDIGARVVRAQAARASQVRAEVSAHPDRILANAAINFCWRNGPVEDIHAGRATTYPLTRRRVRPSEERVLMRSTAGRLAQAITVVFPLLLHEQSGRSWDERVLPFHLVPSWLVTPTGWSLTERTRSLRLPGTEPVFPTRSNGSASGARRAYSSPKRIPWARGSSRL